MGALQNVRIGQYQAEMGTVDYQLAEQSQIHVDRSWLVRVRRSDPTELYLERTQDIELQRLGSRSVSSATAAFRKRGAPAAPFASLS